jgi:hypothetical protein
VKGEIKGKLASVMELEKKRFCIGLNRKKRKAAKVVKSIKRTSISPSSVSSRQKRNGKKFR